MKAEIIAVGTELLLGQIVNTNAQYLSERLAELGIDVYFQSVVGDNYNRLLQTIEIGKQRADLLVFTGGIGPTQDDLTKDVLADFLGRKIVIHEPTMKKIEDLFIARGTHLVESNRRQAHMIEGSDAIENMAGLAVGNGIVVDGTSYMLLPGVPREMKSMMNGAAGQWLAALQPDASRLYSRTLKFAGIGESSLEEKLISLIEKQADPTIAPYAKEGEVAIRVSTKATDEAIANEKIEQVVTEIKRLVGDHLYAEKDIPLEAEVLRLLRQQGKTMASAESISGGMLAELMTDMPGSSGEFAGGVVTYTNQMKQTMLGVPLELLEGDNAPGAISAETAVSMAEKVRELADTDYGISLTGIAGPGTVEGKPVGLVYCGIAAKGQETQVYKLDLFGSRDIIRLRAVKAAFYRLWQELRRTEDAK